MGPLSSKRSISKNISLDQSVLSYDEDLLRDSQLTFFRSLSMERNSVKEILKEMGIGQYMTQNQVEKVSKLWKQMFDVISIINQQNYGNVKNQKGKSCQQVFYIVKKQQNGNIQITSNPNLEASINKTITDENRKNQSFDLEILQQVYPFIYTEEDRSVIQLLIIDYNGLKFLIRLGPPANLRWSCWKALIFENFELIGKYETMLSRINNEKIDYQSQIMKDIQRTLVSHQYFSKNNEGLGQQQLLRVLQAVSMRLPSLGYCQGMNFIAGFLLMVSGSDEKLSYEAFISILLNPKYLFYYVYADGLPLLLYLQHITHQLLFEYDQELYCHIQEICVPDSFWITKMILTIFLYVYRLNSCLRVWDYVLSRGLFGIVELILSTAYIKREEIMNSGLEEFGVLFQGQALLKNSELRIEVDTELLIFHASNNFKIKKSKIVEATDTYITAKQIPNDSIIHCFLNYENKEIFYDVVNQYNQKFLSQPESEIFNQIINEQNK